ncbi:MAG: leucyl aminopeptidase [bacterium]
MNITISQSSLKQQKADILIAFCYEDDSLLKAQKKRLSELFPSTSTVLHSDDFKGTLRSTMVLYTGAKHAGKIIIAGLGKKESCSVESIRRAASAAAKRAAAYGVQSIALEGLIGHGLSAEESCLAILEGAMLSNYKFDKYITTAKNKKKINSIALFSDSKQIINAGKSVLTMAVSIYDGVTLSRNLAQAPNNEIYPETLAKSAIAAAKGTGVKVTVLDKKKIQSLKMGGLLAVNQGSVRPPVFIVMEYKGGKANDKPFVFVGKGITFDTGGISIKPAAGMSDMKGDMHGAATVIGGIIAIAKAKLPVNVVALVPSTENMPSGSALVPGDIVTFMNGKTAEIDNTDAEGRLILADALTYASKFKPKAVIDFATLTGACVVALGTITSGLMGTNPHLIEQIKKASARTNEYVCELPLHEEYEDLIKSDFADVKNSGGRWAGAITAGLFLKHFIGDYPWAHMDIAGTGMAPSERDYWPKGGTGIGVRMLVDLVKNYKA